MEYFGDTICAPATILGTGAVSMIRLSGPDALAITDKVVRFRRGDAASSAGYTVKMGEVLEGDQVLDEVIAVIYRAPRSYTGEDCVEISCHASPYVGSALMRLLLEAGARMAGPGEFTRRAFASGKMDLSQAEAVADLVAAGSKAAHRAAIGQLKGSYSGELRALRDKLVELAALMELELDFSEEDVQFADRFALNELLVQTMLKVEMLKESFKLGNAIRNGVPVAIVGDVNSGKSTLLNSLLGESRAIVSDIPGTTRDTVEDTVVIDGVTFRFIDTAGLRKTSESIEKIGIERSFEALSKADVILCVLDATAGPGALECALAQVLPRIDRDVQRTVFLRNKVDVAGVAAGGAAAAAGVAGVAAMVGGAAAGGAGVAAGVAGAASGVAAMVGGVAAGGAGVASGVAGVAAMVGGAACGGGAAAGGASAGVGEQESAVRSPEGGYVLTGDREGAVRSPEGGYVVTGDRWDEDDFRKIAGPQWADAPLLDISARNGDGLDGLRSLIGEMYRTHTAASDTVVTNLRHYEALCAASEALSRVRDGLGSSLPTDLVAQDLREAIDHLGSIFGAVVTDDILGRIFEKFCIGK